MDSISISHNQQSIINMHLAVGVKSKGWRMEVALDEVNKQTDKSANKVALAFYACKCERIPSTRLTSIKALYP